MTFATLCYVGMVVTVETGWRGARMTTGVGTSMFPVQGMQLQLKRPQRPGHAEFLGQKPLQFVNVRLTKPTHVQRQNLNRLQRGRLRLRGKQRQRRAIGDVLTV